MMHSSTPRFQVSYDEIIQLVAIMCRSFDPANAYMSRVYVVGVGVHIYIYMYV